MIVFATSHDAATIANSRVAEGLATDGDVSLIGIHATRIGLLEQMRAGHQSLFAMAHGTGDGIIDEFDALIFSEPDLDINPAVRVFAFACRTAARLGPRAAAKGATWLGYDRPITAPDDREDVLPVLRELFVFIKQQLELIEYRDASLDFLDQLKQRCEAAAISLDAVFEETPSDSFAAYSCCNQIWQALRIWPAGAERPVIHPQSAPPYIEL